MAMGQLHAIVVICHMTAYQALTNLLTACTGEGDSHVIVYKTNSTQNIITFTFISVTCLLGVVAQY